MNQLVIMKISYSFDYLSDYKIHLFERLSPKVQFERYSISARKHKLSKKRSRVQRLGKTLKIQKKFTAFAASIQVLDQKLKNAPQSSFVLLCIDTQARRVRSRVFGSDQSTEAEAKYIEFEKEAAQNDDIAVALVSTASVGGIREAYPNFFADSTEFLKHLEYIISI